MAKEQQASGRPDVLERFRPTVGRWVGVAGLVLLALFAGTVLSTGVDRATVVVLLVLGLIGALTWSSLVRPTIRAHRRHLLVRNAWTQKKIPWGRIQTVDVRQTVLVVTHDDRVHHAIAVGKSARKLIRGGSAGGGSSIFASDASREFASRPTLEGSEVVGTDYADYVVLKLESYASLHRREGTGEIERTVHWPLVVLTVALLVAVVVVLTFF